MIEHTPGVTRKTDIELGGERLLYAACNYWAATMHERDYRQHLVVAWGKNAFGGDSAFSPKERLHRFAEESIELMQAGGMTMADVVKLVAYVYDRLPGEVPQEIGGVGVTLLAYSQAMNMSAEACERAELLRCIEKDQAHFRRRNEEKKRDGVTTLVQAAE